MTEQLITTEHARGFLTNPSEETDTLVVLIHGHNDWGDRARFTTLRDALVNNGYACLRWSVIRPETKPQHFSVLSIAEEYQQVEEIVGTVQEREQYARVIAVGHSQGSIHALNLCVHGHAQGYVSLMGVVDTNHSLQQKMAAIGLIVDGEGKGSITTPLQQTFEYRKEFFTDFQQWNVPHLLAQWSGPSLFVSGAKDTKITPSEVHKGFVLAHDPKRLLLVDDEHNFSVDTAKRIAETITQWLRLKA